MSTTKRNSILKALGGYLEKNCPDNPVNYDRLADAIDAHLASRESKGDARQDYEVEGFGEWLSSAYAFKGDGPFTRFNMEVAYAAGMERAAQPAEQTAERHDAVCDSQYAAGMQLGWNLCEADNHAEFQRIIGHRRRDACAVLSQPKPEQAVGDGVVVMTAEDAHNLNYLCRSLENLSLKRAPDPKDLDAEFFVTANIGHAVKTAKHWLPIVKDIRQRMWDALCRRADAALDVQSRPAVATAGDGVTDEYVEAECVKRHGSNWRAFTEQAKATLRSDVRAALAAHPATAEESERAVGVGELEALASGWDELSDAAYNDGEFSRRDVWRSAANRLRALIAKAGVK